MLVGLTYHKKARTGSTTINWMLVVVMFLCTTNQLVGFPLDKLVMLAALTLYLLLHIHSGIFRPTELLVLGSIIAIALLSSVANLTFAPMIFFPAIGTMATVIFSKQRRLLLYALYHGIFIHTLFAISFVALAYIIGPGDHVWSLADKGLPFVFSARGFTPTVQTYGTLCILWMVLYTIRKEEGLATKADTIMFAITTLGLVLTLNRSSLLFWIILVAVKMKRLFTVIAVIMFGFLVSFWKEIIAFVTNKSSLESRSELLEGFNISYWNSNSLSVYVFGRGNNELPAHIVEKVKWDHRSDIENGYAMLLHTYGIVGLAFYLLVSITFVWALLRYRKYSEATILTYFLFVSPYLTHEFVSTTFYLFLAAILYVRNRDRLLRKASAKSPL